MLKVVKFGGSSLADGTQFKKVKAIVDADIKRRAVVVSAPGKRFKDDYKITDLLYLTYSHLKYKVDPMVIFSQVKSRYYEISSELGLKVDLDSYFNDLEDKMKAGISEEELVSRGEYFNAILMADYLGYDFIDAKDVIHFTYDGKVDEDKTTESIAKAFQEHEKIVVPGFYGSYPNGEICLFSRGGSDVTGSYVAKGIKADKYENWTDVSGILMADPKLVQNPRKIREVTYEELRELSYSGASVLHEETILPLVDDNIPVEILNTNKPEEEGTLIKKTAEENNYLVTGITGKKGYVAITLLKKKGYEKLDVMMNVLQVLRRYNVNIEHMPSSADSFSIVCEKAKMMEKYYDIVADIKNIPGVQSINEDNDISLVAVVGRNMVMKPGTCGRILSVFGKQKINIKLIDQGREELNIIVGISNADFNRSIQALYDKFAFEEVEID